MSFNSNNINDLTDTFHYLVQRNYEVQENVNSALRSKEYLKAVKTIDEYVKIVDDLIKKALNMAQKYKDKDNEENISICLKVEKMAKHIRTAHLEVEENIIKKYLRRKIR
jgi:hypothetical protein